MEILTDFIPKAGDRVRHRGNNGRIGTFIFVICPDCFEGRWITIYCFNKPAFTGRCKKCNIIIAGESWTSGHGYFK